MVAEIAMKSMAYEAVSPITAAVVLSSNGCCFDIGMTVLAALGRFEQTHEPYCGSTNSLSAGATAAVIGRTSGKKTNSNVLGVNTRS
jgi:hypothetical protein